MFADEARFGRMNRPRPCWAPIGIRPGVACQLIREYVYLYGAVSPQDGTCVYLIMPAPDTECFQIFLNTLAKKYSREFVLLFVDGAGNHRSDKLVIPANIMMHPLPAYSPELNPHGKYLGRNSGENFQKLCPQIRWTRSTPSWRRLHLTSNAIQNSSNPSRRSPTSSGHCDLEAVLSSRFAGVRRTNTSAQATHNSPPAQIARRLIR